MRYDYMTIFALLLQTCFDDVVWILDFKFLRISDS